MKARECTETRRRPQTQEQKVVEVQMQFDQDPVPSDTLLCVCTSVTQFVDPQKGESRSK